MYKSSKIQRGDCVKPAVYVFVFLACFMEGIFVHPIVATNKGYLQNVRVTLLALASTTVWICVYVSVVITDEQLKKTQSYVKKGS